MFASNIRLAERLKTSPFTFAILAINIAWFCWAYSQGEPDTIGGRLRFGAVDAVHVWSGEYWRVGSYMFVHITVAHLLWNTLLGFGFCAAVERVFGSARFLLIYGLSGLAAGCATVVTYYAIPSVGASGPMSGMIGALLAVRLRQVGSFADFWTDSVARSTFLNLAVWILVGTVADFNNRALIGGLVGGALVGFALTSPLRLMPFVAVVLGAFVIVSLKPWWRPQGIEVEALQTYGGSYLLGVNGFPKDPVRGDRFTREACSAGSERACYAHAYVDLAEGSEDQRARALLLLEGDCHAGKPLPCDLLGLRFEAVGDVSRAAKFDGMACDGGIEAACKRLASLGPDAGAP